jgi:hypothetical protein
MLTAASPGAAGTAVKTFGAPSVGAVVLDRDHLRDEGE